MLILGHCDDVEEESLTPLVGVRGGEDLQGATTGSTVSGGSFLSLFSAQLFHLCGCMYFFSLNL